MIFQLIFWSLVSLLLGWVLDKILGDPAWLPHPIVGFGKLIARSERQWNKGSHKVRNGGLLTFLLISFVFIISVCLLLLAWNISVWMYVFLSVISVFYCLAGTTLIREVRMVFDAADRSLDEGRTQVGRIVGRDTSELSGQEVRTAALETLAENLSDGVIAPLFWFMLLGVPGMLAYKMVNTLDSMIGYKNERYLLFGRVAAKTDDIANYIPARLTALLMVLVSGRSNLLSFVRKYGREHASPNSGYPEAALAGILNCRFGGSHNYFGEEVYKPFIGHHERRLTTDDMKIAVRINQWVEVAMITMMGLIPALVLPSFYTSATIVLYATVILW